MLFTQTTEAEGDEFLSRVRAEILRQGKAAGLKNDRRGEDVYLKSAHAKIAFEFGSASRHHRNYGEVVVKVAPRDYNSRFPPRPARYVFDRSKATPEFVAGKAAAIVEKVAEFNRGGKEAKEAGRDSERRKREDEKFLAAAVRKSFPDFVQSGSAGSYSPRARGAYGDYEFELNASVQRDEGGERFVRYEVVIGEPLTAEEAREIAELRKRQQAARQAGRGQGEGGE